VGSSATSWGVARINVNAGNAQGSCDAFERYAACLCRIITEVSSHVTRRRVDELNTCNRSPNFGDANTVSSRDSVTQSSPQPMASDSIPATARCLNCEAPMDGAFCAACGQHVVDLNASTWHVVREALGDATDLDG